MSTEFDRFRESYGEELQRAVAFAGREARFFTKVKADALLELVSRRIGDPSRLRALDVGCGIGLTDELLEPSFRELHGVDVSAGMLEAARRANPGVEYHLGDGRTLPFDDRSFDVAFAICVVHHVPPGEREPFARELARVVRPGGLGVVFEHNPLNPLTRLVVARCAFDDDAILLGVRETTRLLTAGGLGRPERRYVLFVPVDRPVVRRAERLLAPVPLGAQYYVAAERPGARLVATRVE